jgi:hypothetical protein
LKELRNFGVSSNSLTGPFPNISKYTRLLGLYLDDNDFEGTLPEFLGKLTDLSKCLYLQSCQMLSMYWRQI